MTVPVLTVSLSMQLVREYLIRSLDKKIRDFSFRISCVILSHYWPSDTISLKGINAITIVEEKEGNKRGKQECENRGKRDIELKDKEGRRKMIIKNY